MTDLKQLAKRTRALTVRILREAASGHPGGALSMVEIITLLHTEVMRPQPYHPDKAQDIFILSGGHKWVSLVALWSCLGWIPESDALSLRKLSSPYQGHPSRLHTPWCWTSTGSLGQGTAVSVGYALAYQRQGVDKKVYCLLGEGDLNEGVTLEAMRIASHYRLNNLVWILDHNFKMSDHHSKIMVHPSQEAAAFGWLVVDGINGHSFQALRDAFDLAETSRGRPVFIVAETRKGYPIHFMLEDADSYHGSVKLSQEDVDLALKQLEEFYAG